MAEAMIVTAVKDLCDRRLDNALASYRAQVGNPPVNLVDYASWPPTAGNIRRLCEGLGVRYIGVGVRAAKPQANWSAGIAYNIGIRDCGDDLIVSVCPDMVLAPGYLSAALNAYRADPDVLVTCRYYEMNQGDENLVVNGAVAPMRYILSNFDQAVISMSREWWHELRGFDERYVGSLVVDNDLVARALGAGMHKKQLMGLAYHQFHEGGSVHPGYVGPPNEPNPPSKGNPKTWGKLNRTISQGVYGRTRITG